MHSERDSFMLWIDHSDQSRYKVQSTVIFNPLDGHYQIKDGNEGWGFLDPLDGHSDQRRY